MTADAIKMSYLDADDNYIKKEVFFSDKSGFFTPEQILLVDSKQVFTQEQARRCAKYILRSQGDTK